jgi:UDP-2,3-diacylglucosamine pyrophosphatase LpxH
MAGPTTPSPEDTFHALHVVSDLHLGGRKGFQIFDQGPVLAGLIDHLATTPAPGPVALVLNGDVVDFLAEVDLLGGEKAKYLDPEGAEKKLLSIMEEPAFSPVWKALARYVRTPERYLIIALGNHDVEMALPPVRARLIHELCGDSLEARARLIMAVDGTGYAARVGNARVLCVHGNEVDTANVVDHDALRRLIRAMKARTPLPEWEPNAGTRLVVDVMNEIKKAHPLVDLLKPEVEAVLPVLAALDPALLKRVGQLLPVARRFMKDERRRRKGLLSAQPWPEGGGAGPSKPLPATPQARERYGKELVEQARSALDAGLTPFELVDSSEDGDTLGAFGLAKDLFFERDPQESLRTTLIDWSLDSSFLPESEDAVFRDLDASIGPDIDFLIAGHTHLERALRRTRGNGYYFNSGTWARLISLTSELLHDPKQFQQVYKAFQARTMEALDAHPSLVVRRPTVVSIFQHQPAGVVRGALGHVKAAEQGYLIEYSQPFFDK